YTPSVAIASTMSSRSPARVAVSKWLRRSERVLDAPDRLVGRHQVLVGTADLLRRTVLEHEAEAFLEVVHAFRVAELEPRHSDRLERIRGELVEFERLRHAGRLAGDDQRLTQILTGYACEIGARHEHSRAVREHERLRGARRRTVQSLDGATRR